MLRHAILASALVLGTLGSAAAQQGPRLIGSGDNAQLVYDNGGMTPPGNVVGGGYAMMTGSGDNARLAYTQPRAVQQGLVAEMQGSGDNAVLTYHAVPGADTAVAGRSNRRPGG